MDFPGTDLTSSPGSTERYGHSSQQLPRSNSDEAPETVSEDLSGRDASQFLTGRPRASSCDRPSDDPTASGTIFCRPRASLPGSHPLLFRLRDGNTEIMATFLAWSAGLDITAERERGPWVWPVWQDPPAHLVELIRHTKTEEGSVFGTRTFYFAVGESCASSVGTQRPVPEYKLLSPMAPNFFFSTRFSHNLNLESSCLLNCGSCKRWYEIRVYR